MSGFIWDIEKYIDNNLELIQLDLEKTTRAVWRVTCCECGTKDVWDTPFMIHNDGSCGVNSVDAGIIFNGRRWSYIYTFHRFLPNYQRWYCPKCNGFLKKPRRHYIIHEPITDDFYRNEETRIRVAGEEYNKSPYQWGRAPVNYYN